VSVVVADSGESGNIDEVICVGIGVRVRQVIKEVSCVLGMQFVADKEIESVLLRDRTSNTQLMNVMSCVIAVEPPRK
jgi:hypothetical protein